jgi:hypothetical protein
MVFIGRTIRATEVKLISVPIPSAVVRRDSAVGIATGYGLED